MERIIPEEDYEIIRKELGREPNLVEQGCFLNLWSEHCAYRSSSKLLKTLPTQGERVVVGPGEDAAVIRLENDICLVIGMESHNHPSYVDPYSGAATGVGGIVRDILCMGARPIALMDPLYFGNIDNPKNLYLFEHVVAGISDYGNCIGVPVVRGECFFDESYSGNPLVNVVCIGIVKEEKIISSKGRRAGDYVVLIGSTTGRDGLGGASFASRDLSSTPDEDRPSVQIGDPYTEKLIIEATLEAMDRGIVEACKDLGAAGLAGASSEMAAGGGLGIRIFADAVPLREKGLTTYEILLAESQERMIIEVRPENVEEIAEIARKYDIAFGVVGVLTQEKKFVVEHNGEVVVDLPMDLLVGGAPPYDRKARKRTTYTLPSVSTEVSDYRNIILKILSSPNVAFKDWVFRQYDHEVQIRTYVKPGEDCGVLLDPMCEHMIALSCGCNPRHVALNPYEGTKLSIIENSSNLAVVGAEPICIVNCLNFGNPEDEEVYWDFRESVRGLGDGAREIGVPVVGGNVSFYNESEEFGTEVLPTPSIGMVGILPKMRVPSMYLSEGESIVLVGATYDEMLGSEFYECCGVLSESNAPKFRREYVESIKKVREVVRQGIVSSAHDLSIGGLAVGICKMALKCGAEVRIEHDSATLNTLLFSETYGRFVLGVEEEFVDEVLSKTGGQVIGKAGGKRIKINDILLDLSDVQTALSSLTKTMIGDEK